MARAPHCPHGLVLVLIQVDGEEAAEHPDDDALKGEGVDGVHFVELRDEGVELEDVHRGGHVPQELDLVPRLAHDGRPHQVECKKLVLAGGCLLSGKLEPVFGSGVLLCFLLAGCALLYHSLPILLPRGKQGTIVEHIGANYGEDPRGNTKHLFHAHGSADEKLSHSKTHVSLQKMDGPLPRLIPKTEKHMPYFPTILEKLNSQNHLRDDAQE